MRLLMLLALLALVGCAPSGAPTPTDTSAADSADSASAFMDSILAQPDSLLR